MNDKVISVGPFESRLAPSYGECFRSRRQSMGGDDPSGEVHAKLLAKELATVIISVSDRDRLIRLFVSEVMIECRDIEQQARQYLEGGR